LPRNDQQKETNDHRVMSARELWFAIRDLDPESNHRESEITATVAVFALIFVVSVVCVLLRLRGL
jgi:hypothetical protein